MATVTILAEARIRASLTPRSSIGCYVDNGKMRINGDSMKSLKASYTKQLTTFTVVNIVIFWLVFISPVKYNDWTTVFILTAKDFMFLIFPPFITLIINGLVSANNKTRLVFAETNPFIINVINGGKIKNIKS